MGKTCFEGSNPSGSASEIPQAEVASLCALLLKPGNHSLEAWSGHDGTIAKSRAGTWCITSRDDVMGQRCGRDKSELAMDTVTLVWKWLNDNAGALGIVLVIFPLAWTTYTYLTRNKIAKPLIFQ